MRTGFGSTLAVRLAACLKTILAVAIIGTSPVYTASEAEGAKRKTVRKAARKSVRKKRVRKVRKARKSRRKTRRRASRKRRSSHNPRFAAYVMDAKTGKVLFARNSKAHRYPASLTKMMTLYLVFEDLKSGRIKGSDRVVMTKAGARRPPSKIGLRVGQSISVDQAVMTLVTKSANDVATAIADKLSGNEAAFARRMTRKARALGMHKTTFRNASGLTASGQLTTAADMARLGLALREHFPRKFKLFQTRSMKLGRRRLPNHNRLLGRVRGVDGIKTGYTRASGFNLVTSAGYGGRRIVAVVMGGRSGASRNAYMTRLVRSYLPKASRGKGRMLIARATGAGTERKLRGSLLATTLPKVAPLPDFAPRSVAGATAKATESAGRVASAHAVSTTRADRKAVVRALAALRPGSAPTPLERPAGTDPVVVGTTATDAAAPAGWQVQIAAAGSRSQALETLGKVRDRHSRIVAGTRDFTETVKGPRGTFVRARFAGFASKAAARKACAALKRRRVACLAVPG